MRCGDMEDVGVEAGAKELSAEEAAAEESAEEEAAEEARQAKKAWERELNRKRQARYRERHPKEVKERNDAHYQDIKYAIRARQYERNAQLRLAGDGAAGAAGEAGAAGAAYTFGVLPGCKLECYPGACKACFNSKDRHAVWVRIRAAYEIEARDEVSLPVDARAEAEFLAGLGRFWCRDDCGDYLKTRVKCRFHGECQRCSAVNRREKDCAAANTLFYEAHRNEVQESRDLAQAQFQCWLDSWKLEGVPGAQWRAAFEQELVELTLRRR
jgi:hypothetical protein